MNYGENKAADFCIYAFAYLKAVFVLHPSILSAKATESDRTFDQIFLYGPIYNNLGLAAELTFKSIILNSDPDYDLKKGGHNLEDLFEEAGRHQDLSRMHRRISEFTSQMDEPTDLMDRLKLAGKNPSSWRLFGPNLLALNSNYSKYYLSDHNIDKDHFRTRYPPKTGRFRGLDVRVVYIGLETLLEDLNNELHNS